MARRCVDDGQRNCPKHVEFYSSNKLETLVHLVAFIIRIELKQQLKIDTFLSSHGSLYKCSKGWFKIVQYTANCSIHCDSKLRLGTSSCFSLGPGIKYHTCSLNYLHYLLIT